ncbi:hypothetical protein HYFRA_00009923 [Hymenoscyphus fraxineus]|uniref:FAD-binding PCMH-type domain-containing protein n=1 Tax=Hymenoscyphus fraxineus TaxID=746836 RepID=A0A9N9L4V0_9HELO|nr:hypothetical protein HYFRA_00009923 [Hymenoscyphus fraxineus]
MLCQILRVISLTTLFPLAGSPFCAAVISTRQTNSSCRAIPGDSNWPSQDVWTELNKTVGGRLIATIPQAAVCHREGYGGVQYDEAACAALAKVWDFPKTYINGTCELGNYVSYAISVSGVEDVVAGIRFSQENNVRLVIKNTGHDFLGKSTGKGGLSLWTRNLQDMEIIPTYNSSSYTGPAIKIGAGRSGGEALLLAHDNGYRLVTGDCPTVGIAGGYASGGGHGYLNGAYGMAADNVLEWEVVTADGQHLIATPTENADLYWALSGGGAGTYAVVLSMTTKIYPDDGPIGAATLSFNASSTSSASPEIYAAGLQAWWEFLPSIIDTGATAAFNFINGQFLVYNTTAPGKTADDMAVIYEPYLAKLRSLNINFQFATYAAPSYFGHYQITNGPLPDGPYVSSMLFNSRFIPRVISGNSERSRKLTTALITAMDTDPAANWQFGCMGLNVNSTRIQHPDNSVVSYWREAVAVCLDFSIYDWTIPESAMLERRQDLASVVHPLIEAETQESGAYLNEADPLVYPKDNPGKWQSAFYGTNYQRLREIKDKYDPASVFYAYTAVGSEDWVEDGEGRLCRA